MTAPKRIQMSRQHPWRAENPDAIIVARPSKYLPGEIGHRLQKQLRIVPEHADALVAEVAESPAVVRRPMLVVPPELVHSPAYLAMVYHADPEFSPSLGLPLLRTDSRDIVATPPPGARPALDKPDPHATLGARPGSGLVVNLCDPMPPLDRRHKTKLAVPAQSVVADLAIATSVSRFATAVERASRRG